MSIRKKIAVAISGGVDSFVAAYLLKKNNVPIVGINFITGFEDKEIILRTKTKLNEISKRLNFSIKSILIKREFKKNVIDYFIETYSKGKTPNPCIICNSKIKFGLLMRMAEKLGASKIATGHYARIERCLDGGSYLIRSADSEKDQSYFLGMLTQKQLLNIVFPIGNMTKSQVRRIALENNFKPVFAKESQDVCFVKTRKYSDFIDKYAKNKAQPGKIVNTYGEYLGIHKGLRYFTIGQRRGINCPAKEPYYVVRIDEKNNCLIVGKKKHLYSSKCIIKNINWTFKIVRETTKIKLKIRYRGPIFKAILRPLNTTKAILEFNFPQISITPGQGAVFYIKNRIIGSGWIE